MQSSEGVAFAEQEGNSEENPRDAGMEQAKPSEDVKTLLQKLRKLCKNQHTLDLANSIFADLRVRTLGYM